MRIPLWLLCVLTFAALPACSSAAVDPKDKLDPETRFDGGEETVDERDLDAGRGLDAAADATTGVPKSAVEAGPPIREHAVLQRTCERKSYAPDYLLVPTSTDCGPRCRTGTECASSQDCTRPKGGDCIGLLGARCEYAGVPGANDDICSTDQQCTRGPSPHCPREIRFSFCLYGTCRSHADCAPDERCECPTGGHDPVCTLLGCDRDADCPASQTCRVDQSYTGVANHRHCSTPQDTCASQADCESPDACGFITEKRHWSCRPFALID